MDANTYIRECLGRVGAILEQMDRETPALLPTTNEVLDECIHTLRIAKALMNRDFLTAWALERDARQKEKDAATTQQWALCAQVATPLPTEQDAKAALLALLRPSSASSMQPAAQPVEPLRSEPPRPEPTPETDPDLFS